MRSSSVWVRCGRALGRTPGQGVRDGFLAVGLTGRVADRNPAGMLTSLQGFAPHLDPAGGCMHLQDARLHPQAFLTWPIESRFTRNLLTCQHGVSLDGLAR